jgi:hypothetical protein
MILLSLNATVPLRGLLNAGFGRDRPYKRYDAQTRTVEDCPTFAMAVLAGIGTMPDTIEDRAVVITMRRRAANETVAKFRLRRDKPAVRAWGDRLAAWVAPRAQTIGDAEPVMPDGLGDRAEDCWESLIAVADLAGGTWPARARAAAVRLAGEAAESDAEQSLEVRLLADIRAVFGSMPHVGFLATSVLIVELRKIEGSPWSDFDFTARKLALRLVLFKIGPRHNSAKTERGYHLEDLAPVFGRYLTPEPSVPSAHVPTPDDLRKLRDGSASPDGSTRPAGSTRPGETPGQEANGRYRTRRTVHLPAPGPSPVMTVAEVPGMCGSCGGRYRAGDELIGDEHTWCADGPAAPSGAA